MARRRLRAYWNGIQKRYFDDTDSPGRKAIDAAISEIMQNRATALEAAQVLSISRISWRS